MNNKLDIELFEKYFEGKLSGDEHKDFEHRLENDAEFSTHFNDYKIAVKTISEFGKQEMKTRLKRIHNEEVLQKAKFGRREWMRLAAVFIGLLIVSSPFLYNYYTATADYSALYEENFTLYPDILSERGEASQRNIMLGDAMSYYKNKDFENASLLFQNVLNNQDPKNNSVITLYSGIAYLGAGKTKQAIGVFEKITQDPNHPFTGQAKWYLALCMLNTEDIESTKKILNEISTENTYNSVKAKQMLKAL